MVRSKAEFIIQASPARLFDGAGVRFRETRLMNGKEVSPVLKATEYVKDGLDS